MTAKRPLVLKNIINHLLSHYIKDVVVYKD